MNEMTMTYELITPEIAEKIMKNNTGNRSLSMGTVRSYAQDMRHGNWNSSVGSAISIDKDGILRDGQHRLAAIMESGVSVWMWVCRNVDHYGVYDNNRKRSNSDQITIMRPDYEAPYRNNKYVAIARQLITQSSGEDDQRKVGPMEIIEFTDEHKDALDKFFLRMKFCNVPKVGIAAVYLSMFMAFSAGVEFEKLEHFNDVLSSGMSTKPEEFPIIAYRNYLKDARYVPLTKQEISRCQYAIKKFLSGSCTKKTMVPKDLIYPYPFEKEQAPKRKRFSRKGELLSE